MYGIVYKATNTVTGRFYIGQTKTTLSKRWSKHCSDARRGAGWVLADAIRKHGAGAFVLKVLEECADKQALNAAEVFWIETLRPAYNACAGGGGLGSPTPEVRKKISLAMKGLKRSDVTKKNMSAAQKGHTVSESTREKLRARFKGVVLRKSAVSTLERQQTANRNRARRIHPERHDLAELYSVHGAKTRGEKISLALVHGIATGRIKRRTGALNPMYGKEKPETIKRQLSEIFSGTGNPYYGKSHSDEIRAKMRAAHAARPPVVCPHCGKEGHVNTMKRWHFDNCRSKP